MAECTKVRICSASYHLPGKRRSLSSWVGATGADATLVAKLKASGTEHFYSADGKSTPDLILNSVETLAERTALDNSIRHILYFSALPSSMQSVTSEVFLPIMKRFSLERAKAYTICGQYCVSILSAIKLARSFLSQNAGHQKVLIVGADAMPDDTHRHLHGAGLLSDAACSFVVEKGRGPRGIGDIQIRTDSRFASGYLSARDRTLELLEAESEITNLTHLLDAALSTCQSEIRIYPYNANLGVWKRLTGLLKLPDDMFYLHNLARKGHAFGCDPIINLVDNWDTNQAIEMLFLTAGYGLNFGSVRLSRN